MAENRSLRVSISADVADYVSGMEKAARATRDIAVAAGEARGKVEGLGTGTSAGLTKLSERLDKVAKSLGRVNATKDLSGLANAVRMLSNAGSGLTDAVKDITKLSKALAGVTPTSAKNMKDVANALRELGNGTRLNDIARDLGKMSTSLSGLTGVRDLALLANGVRSLSGAGAGLTGAVNDIKRFASAIRSIDSASATGMREIAAALHDLGHLNMAGAAEETTKMSAGVRRLIKDANSVPALRALAAALRDLGQSGAGLGSLGNTGHALAGLQSQIDQLTRRLNGLRNAGGGGGSGGRGGSGGGIFGQIFGGAALANLASNAAQRALALIGTALKSTVSQTADFETEINTLGAVLKASPEDLEKVSKKALQLGADFTIANTNASDATVTMTELAKGGLNLSDSMSAAKGTLQLATAGQVDFTKAADIMTSQLAAYGLQADQASRVTDLLANTANASRGNIADFAEGFKYAGTVSHQAGYSIEETAAVLSVFAKAGLTGSVGGTVMKEMLLKLEAPSKKARKAIEELGIQVYDSNGEFIKAPALADTLAAAHKRLGNEAFQAAATEVFQARAIQGASIMAAQGGKAIDAAADKTRAGAGAAAYSAARMQGLGGAFANLRNQVETAQIQIGEKFSPALQTVVRAAAKFVPELVKSVTTANATGLLASIGHWFDPLIKGAQAVITVGWPYIKTFVGELVDTFRTVVGSVQHVTDGIGKFLQQAVDHGSVKGLGEALGYIGHALGDVAKFLSPVGNALGSVITFFGNWGPLATTAGLALAGVAATRLGLMALTKINFLGFGTAMRFAGDRARTFGLNMAVFQARGWSTIPSVLGAAGKAAQGFGKAVFSAFGGGIGLIIAGVTTVIALFANANDDSKKAVEDNNTAISDLEGTVNSLTGALTLASGIKITEKWRTDGVAEQFKDIGNGVGEASSSIITGGAAITGYRDKILHGAAATQFFTDAQKKASLGGLSLVASSQRTGIAYEDIARAAAAGGPQMEAMSKRLLANGDDSYAATTGLQTFHDQAEKGIPVLGSYDKAVDNAGQASKNAAQKIKDAYDTQLAASLSYASGGVSGMELANEAVQVQAAKMSGAFGGVKETVKIAADDTSGFFTMVRNQAGTATEALTPMQQAFKDYNDAVAAADTTSQLFMLTMDKLAHRDTSVNDAMDANAAAAEGIAAAERQKQQNAIDLRKAQADLQKARDNEGKQELVDNIDPKTHKTLTNEDGTPKQHWATASDATDADDIAAAALRVADAQAKVDGTQRDMNKSDEDYRKTAALRLAQVQKQSLSTKTYAETIKSVTAEMKTQREAYIKAKTDNGVDPAEAAKQADAQGFRTDTQSIVLMISADATGAQATFADLRKTVDDYSGQVDKIPAAKKTVFNAEIAVAEKNGTRLYQVFDKASGTYKTVFETPNAAEAQIRAGGLVKQYDKAKGTWTAELKVKDNTKGEAAATAMRLDIATRDRTTRLKVATADALGTLSYYGGNLKRIPPEKTTKLKADVKEAQASGERLYQTYDTTTGNWIATFMTTKDAESKIKAGAVVRQYDLAKGTWTGLLQATDNASPKAINLQKQAQLATMLRTLKLEGVDDASPKVQALKKQLTDLQTEAAKPIKLVIGAVGQTVQVNKDGTFTTGAGKTGFASGGYVSGPGGPREDKIPAMLSNGEFVVNAAATKEHLPALTALNKRKKYADGGLVGNAVGPLNLALQETGNINPALKTINEIVNNARKSAKAINDAAQSGNAIGAAAVRAAETQLGVPYVYAAETPGVAFDCSGLTQWAYAQVGVALDHYSGAQAVGQQVSREQLQPGDLTVWDGHVNMYIGNGKIIEAPQPGDVVHERPLYTENQGDPFLGFWRPAVLAKGYRPAPDTSDPRNPQDTGTSAPIGDGAGMEKYRALASSVFAAKNVPVQYVNTLIKQGDHESSGNPQAINLTDSNAQRGDPSKGLLQFTGATFAEYADPGYNSNIYDPESQFRAFVNYINGRYGGMAAFTARQEERGYGAYANGGLVRGPGTGKSDSIPARVSNGEFIVNADSTAANLPLLSAINNRYANGGLVGNLHALQGGVASSAGPELASVVEALQAIAQAVLDARDAISAKRDKEQTKWDSLITARTSAASQIATAEGRLAAARKAAGSSAAAQGAEAAAQLQSRAVSANNSLSAAQARVVSAQNAPHVGQWGKTLHNAEAALKRAQSSAASAQAALEARIAAVTKSKATSGASRIELAQLQLTKVQTMTKLSVGNAQRAYDAAHKMTQAYVATANAAEAYQRAQQRVFQQQQNRAAQMDTLATRLEAAKANVASLRESRGSMMSSISSNVAGFSGGLVGHQDTRQTFDRILQGQQYDVAQTQKFNLDIAKLRKLGLSKDALNTIASSGPESAGITASVLARANKDQIAALNRTQTQLHHIGDNVGNVVAGDFYDAGIQAGNGLIKGLQSQMAGIQKVMDSVADSIISALTKKLQIHSPSRVMEGHGVNIVEGLNNGIVATQPKVAATMGQLVQMPPVARLGNTTSGSSGPQRIDVQVYLDGERIDDRVDVKIDGFAVDLRNSYRKAGDQS